MKPASSDNHPPDYANRLYMKMINVIAEQDATIKRLQHELKKDELTRLHNFGYWADTMEIYKHKTDDGIMLISLDVNMLKPTNDNFGHDTGDQLLIDVSHILKSAFRDDDTIVRKGGDEFAVAVAFNFKELKAEYDQFVSENYMPNPPTIEEYYEHKIYHRIQTLVSNFNDNLPEGHVPVGLSCGVALSIPTDGQPPHNLDATFRLADTRMYHDKHITKSKPINEFLLK